MIASAPDEGVLSVEESELISHIVYMSEVTIERLLTPLDLTSMLPETALPSSFIEDEAIARYSRIPIYREQRDQLVGYVAQRDVLRVLAIRGDHPGSLLAFLNPLPSLSFDLSVEEATRQLLASREAIASVGGPDGRPLGIITLEDLLETLTGMEITDEPVSPAGVAYDPRRRERLKRLREKRDQWQAASEEKSR
jgi:CBS domain containing-hemolysin-like protein